MKPYNSLCRPDKTLALLGRLSKRGPFIKAKEASPWKNEPLMRPLTQIMLVIAPSIILNKINQLRDNELYLLFLSKDNKMTLRKLNE